MENSRLTYITMLFGSHETVCQFSFHVRLMMCNIIGTENLVFKTELRNNNVW